MESTNGGRFLRQFHVAATEKDPSTVYSVVLLSGCAHCTQGKLSWRRIYRHWFTFFPISASLHPESNM